MCNFKKNLVAWMDGELSTAEAAIVEQHVAACSDCRQSVAACESASRDFAARYFSATQPAADTVTAASRLPRWVPLAAVAAAIVVAFVLLPRNSVQPQTAAPPVAAAIDRPVQAAVPASIQQAKPVRLAAKRRSTTHRISPQSETIASEPTVRIAIPADAIYPPGAVPEGMAYFANVSFAADGSVQAFRLQR